MIIAVTAPKKGLGQTTTTINIAAGLVKIMGEFKMPANILIIDINKYCKDIEYYLSNTVVTRGLDDFFSLYQSDLLTEDSFKTCVKQINDNISILGSNEYFEITDDAMIELLKMVERLYDFIVIDALGSANINGMQKVILERADKVIVTLNQTKSVTQIVKNKRLGDEIMAKVIYALNRNMTVMDTGLMDYSIDVIKDELEEMGIESPIFPLNFDVEIMNEGNYGSVLSYVLGDKSNKNEYNKQLKELIKEIIKEDPKYKELIENTKEEKKGIFGIRR